MFNKTFYKFLLSFLGVIVAALALIVVVGVNA